MKIKLLKKDFAYLDGSRQANVLKDIVETVDENGCTSLEKLVETFKGDIFEPDMSNPGGKLPTSLYYESYDALPALKDDGVIEIL